MSDATKTRIGLNIAPTPWRVGPVDDTTISAADRSEVACVDGDYNDPDTWPIMEANACLIAAAPDLFAIVDELYRYALSGVTYALPRGSITKMDAALTKARGAA